MKILIVSPHPDDAEIGLGGSMTRWINEGHEVTIAVCTGLGDLNMVHSGQTVKWSQRVAEQEKAAAMIGAKVAFLDLAPASKFDTVPMSKFVGMFDEVFRLFDSVYVPLPSANRDHQIVFDASMAAFRQGKLDDKPLLAYHQPMQHWGCHADLTFGRVYLPMDWDAVSMKLQLIAQHQSQMGGRESYGLYSPRSIMVWAETLGAECGDKYAELVTLIRARTSTPF